MRITRPLGLSIAVIGIAMVAGCAQTTYTTERTLHVNQTANLWRDASYRYVTTGVMASASAEPGSAESKSLTRTAMNALVQKAALKRNQALVDVTVEEGVAVKGTDTRQIITLRGDVVEFLPGAKAK